MTNWVQELRNLRACSNAIEYAKTLGHLDSQATWEKYNRGDWMLWLLGKSEVDRKTLVLAACQCARLSLKFMEKEELRPLKAIETAENWARDGGVTLAEVANVVNTDATYAATDPYNDAAYAAIDAASAAAYTAIDSTAAAVASTSTAEAARTDTLEKCAEIVREFFPNSPI